MQPRLRFCLTVGTLACAMKLAVCQAVAPAPQRFVCNTGYSIEQCHVQMAVLRSLLSRYGGALVGEWTWILVKSDDWKAILLQHRMDPDSPAFTVLDRRETFFEEALVNPVTVRRIELVRKWSLGIDDLLALAVTHELGHALCNEKSERKADGYGEELRRGEVVVCK